MLGAVFNEPAINVGYLCGAIALFFVAAHSDIWRSLMAGMLGSITLIVIFAILLYRGSASIWVAIAVVVRLLRGVAGRGGPARLPRERARGPGARSRGARARRSLPARSRDARPGGGRPRTQPPRPRAARRRRSRPERGRPAGRRGAARLRQEARRGARVPGSIESTGRQALGDIERLLGILRAEAGRPRGAGPAARHGRRWSARRPGPRGRRGGHRRGPAARRRSAVEPRPLGLPDRAGGSHQHPQARRQRGARDRAPALQRRLVRDRMLRRRRRPAGRRPVQPAAQRRPRPAGHARARRPVRRRARGGAACPRAGFACWRGCRSKARDRCNEASVRPAAPREQGVAMAADETIRIVLVDDEQMVRAGPAHDPRKRGRLRGGRRGRRRRRGRRARSSGSTPTSCSWTSRCPA